MQEDFLHYLWKHKKFDVSNLKTTKKEVITLINVGRHNHNAGPDFFNAKLKIGEQLWAGNLENTNATQGALLSRAKANSLATKGNF